MQVVEHHGQAATDIRVVRCGLENLFLNIPRKFRPKLQNRTAEQLFELVHSYRPSGSWSVADCNWLESHGIVIIDRLGPAWL